MGIKQWIGDTKVRYDFLINEFDLLDIERQELANNMDEDENVLLHVMYSESGVYLTNGMHFSTLGRKVKE